VAAPPTGSSHAFFGQPAQEWAEKLEPEHWTPDTRADRAAIQTWVLRSADRSILIDTGVGNSMPTGHASHAERC